MVLLEPKSWSNRVRTETGACLPRETFVYNKKTYVSVTTTCKRSMSTQPSLMKQGAIIAVALSVIVYVWQLRRVHETTPAQVITQPLHSSENRTEIERCLLNPNHHTSYQFPLAIIEYLQGHADVHSIPISRWSALVNVSAKTELGQMFLKSYDVDRLILMKDTLRTYDVDFHSSEALSRYNGDSIADTISSYFGTSEHKLTYKSIQLSPSNFDLDKDTNIPLLPEKQQHFLTDNISHYRYYKEGSLLNQSGLAHYELRFFDGRILPIDRIGTLHRIVRAWARFTNKSGIKTWIAHGSLLGYYFNGLIMPWDDDLDVQVTADSFWELVKLNQTLVIDYNDPEAIGTYLIDVNPFFVNRGKNSDNKLDARFIDVNTGLYIDITTLTSELNPLDIIEEIGELRMTELYKVFDPYHDDIVTETEEHEHETFKSMNESIATNSLISCKDHHFYTVEELSPLIPTIFEGEILYVPNNIANLLLREYKRKSLYLKEFKGFTYDPVTKLWTHPEIESEYNEQMAKFIKLHHHIKQTTFKRHIFHESDLITVPNFRLDPQIRKMCQ